MEYQQDSDDRLSRAYADMETYGIPNRVYQAWLAQYHSAKRRGIPFLFSLLAWHLWWKSELRKLGPDAQRGRGRCQYVMARKRDRGAYEPGNVKAVHPKDNAADRDPDEKAATAEKVRATRLARGKPLGVHLMVRGDGHPRSMAVITSLGRFGSIALASEAHGITRAGGHYRVKRGQWRLEVP